MPRSQALETLQLGFRELNGRKSCWTCPGSAPMLPWPFPNFLPEPCWTFSGTLLNVTWLCTKASPTFARTFSGTLLNLTWFCTKASQTFSEPSEPPPEPCWIWPSACTSAHRNYSGLKICWGKNSRNWTVLGRNTFHNFLVLSFGILCPGNCVSELPWIGKNDYVFGFCHH